MIDLIASQPHYVEHMAPVWSSLPEQVRGVAFVGPRVHRTAKRLGLPSTSRWSGSDGRGNPVMVASSRDLHFAGRRPAIYMEHGAGQTYLPGHRAFAGGPGRDHVGLFLCPSERVADINRRAYPDSVVEVIGCPMLDRWHGLQHPRAEPPTVAISFHWNSQVVPETRTAFPHYRPALRSLSTAMGLKVIGHAHPRIFDRLARAFRAESIEVVRHFGEVLDRADLYVCDNSSSLFMFASTGRPVVTLNAPWYRRDVEHGLRFWDAADVGYQVDEPDQLLDTIHRALVDGPEQAQRREELCAAIYAHRDGTATAAAVSAIEAWLESREARAAA